MYPLKTDNFSAANTKCNLEKSRERRKVSHFRPNASRVATVCLRNFDVSSEDDILASDFLQKTYRKTSDKCTFDDVIQLEITWQGSCMNSRTLKCNASEIP